MRLLKPFTLKVVLAAVLLSLTVLPLPSAARTLEEIQNDINQQTGNLNSLESQLKQAEQKLRNLQGAMGSTQGEVGKLQAEIGALEAEMQYNKLQIETSTKEQELKGLQQEERKARQERAVRHSYVKSRSQDKLVAGITGTVTRMKQQVYESKVAAVELGGVETLAFEIDELATELANLEESNKTLAAQNETLKQKKAELEAQILALQRSVNSQAGAVAGLRSESGILKASIAQLSAEQKAVQDYEAWILGQSGNGGTNTVASGQIYFTGRGRDLAQGHGVGMSQYGAKGAADSGWTGEQILQFYYRGAAVTQYGLSPEITVQYCQGNPALAPYQEGCYYGGVYYGPVVVERVSFEDYLSGLGEMPSSWPVEARRAQVIAARTYAARYTANGNPNYPICLTTYCQVSYFKTGNQGERATVESTRNLVITYSGQLIESLYSADNNQGKGTADHDTRFQDIYGNPTGSRPYLVSVNDNTAGFTPAKMYWNYYCPGTACGDWTYRTNGYTYAHIDAMLDHVNANSAYASVRAQVNSIRAAIGNVVAINFERDGSDRVKKVLLTGTTGQTRALGGWWFKSIWNAWVYNARPSGQEDYIYSQTFFLLTK